MDYYSYYVPKDKEDHQGEGVIVTVYPDLDYIKQLFTQELKFWNMVLNKKPPEMVQADFKTVRLLVARSVATEWKRLAQEMVNLEATLLEYGPRIYFQGTGVIVHDGEVKFFKEKTHGRSIITDILEAVNPDDGQYRPEAGETC